MTEPPAWGRARRQVAYAVIRGDDPQVFIAEDDMVLTRVIALRVIAATPPTALGSAVDQIREALLAERWPDALAAWMTATGEVVDAYPDEPVRTDRDLDEESVTFELRMAPIFEDPPANG